MVRIDEAHLDASLDDCESRQALWARDCNNRPGDWVADGTYDLLDKHREDNNSFSCYWKDRDISFCVETSLHKKLTSPIGFHACLKGIHFPLASDAKLNSDDMMSVIVLYFRFEVTLPHLQRCSLTWHGEQQYVTVAAVYRYSAAFKPTQMDSTSCYTSCYTSFLWPL
jgi:hypothetical protein